MWPQFEENMKANIRRHGNMKLYWMLSRPGPQSSTSSIPSANLLRSVIKLFKLGRLEFKKFNMWKAQALHFIAPIVSDRQSWGIEGDLVSDETGPV